MDRSQPKPIKHSAFASSPLNETRQNLSISQSLPANYYSNLCPQAPLQQPTPSPKLPPAFHLPQSPADFQKDYSARAKKSAMSYSLKMYTGPAISTSMPTWEKNPFLSAGGAVRQRKVSSLEQIPDSQHKSSDFNSWSLTNLYPLNEDSKDISPATYSSEEKKPWGALASKEHARDKSKMSESDDQEEDEEADLHAPQEEEVFQMDL